MKNKCLLPACLTAIIICFSTELTVAQKTKEAVKPPDYLFNDAHFHLTNYIQEGTDIHKFLEIMGEKVGRSVLFGLPLQQTWSYATTGDFAPTYYLATDDPLYYYSFTDAFIAMAYRSLSPEEQKRIDPMITGFNPCDMYAADHIRRVLMTFPGVFTGVGEFSIHKEFVSSKIAGSVASLTNPALDSILDFCAEVGLQVIIHNDIDMPFPKSGQDNWDVKQFSDLLKRHPNTPIIWAHCGLGRIVRPVQDQAAMIDRALNNPALNHVNIDISWTEVAKYMTSSPEVIERCAALLNNHPDRFLMGTDEVAPQDQASYLKIIDMYKPLLDKLTPETREKIMKGNYERLFDAARIKVRAWEKAHANDAQPTPAPGPISGTEY